MLEVLRAVQPRVVHLPLTIPGLNHSRWAPHKARCPRCSFQRSASLVPVNTQQPRPSSPSPSATRNHSRCMQHPPNAAGLHAERSRGRAAPGGGGHGDCRGRDHPRDGHSHPGERPVPSLCRHSPPPLQPPQATSSAAQRHRGLCHITWVAPKRRVNTCTCRTRVPFNRNAGWHRQPGVDQGAHPGAAGRLRLPVLPDEYGARSEISFT